MEILWQLRYRSPLAPTKGVDDVSISTDIDDEAEARRVADWWLSEHKPSPATRFIYVRKHVVATSEMRRKALGEADPEATPPGKPAGTARKPPGATTKPPAGKHTRKVAKVASEPQNAETAPPATGATMPGRVGA
jgi:hypothetical protein